MKTIKELTYNYMKTKHMTRENAISYACQQILINKISSSDLVDKVLLKGGVVMYNLTKNTRRATRDMDFDLIRYDLSSPASLNNLVKCFNKRYPEYKVSMVKHKQLNQDDYHGVKITLEIKDKSMTTTYDIDVGVHTLFAIKQNSTIFDFPNSNNKLLIKVNPPEQMIAEKLYSLAKIGPASRRIRDIYDVYYLLNNCKINPKVCKQCFELLTHDKKHDLKDLEDVCSQISNIFDDKEFAKRARSSDRKWIDINYETIKKEIVDFLYNL